MMRLLEVDVGRNSLRQYFVKPPLFMELPPTIYKTQRIHMTAILDQLQLLCSHKLI